MEKGGGFVGYVDVTNANDKEVEWVSWRAILRKVDAPEVRFSGEGCTSPAFASHFFISTTDA
jgi:hypothetical protein